MNKVSKIITALLLACYFFSSASVFAENKKSVTTVEERKQIEEYFVKALNGELENGKGDKVEETSSEVLETVQGKTLNVVERYTPTDSLQEVKAERKTAEQYISLLKKLDKEIGKIADDKKKTLAKLEADAKAEIKASYQEIEETTVQKFTERDADFAARKKGLKYAAMKTVNNKLEQEKQKTSLSYDQAMQNRVIEKNTLEKELTQIEFFEPATLAIGEFFRETSQSTLQYFPVEISNTRLSLNGFKGRLEIEKEDEEKALYINKNKANFKARVIYKVDVKNDYKLTLLAAEVIDKNNDKVLKRFEDFSYKVEPVKSKEETKKTVKKSKKRERYVNSLCNELIVSANNNFCNGFNNVCVNVQYLPLCLYNNHYSFKAGGGISFNNDYEIMAIIKNGLNFKRLSLELGTGIVFSNFNFKEMEYVASTEMELRFTDYFGINIAYMPADFSFANNKVNADWKHTISVGLTLTGMYF